MEANCDECTTYTLTISGLNDSILNPGTDIFGTPLPLCGSTNLNGTFTGTISESIAEWGFYGSLYQACGDRQFVYTNSGVTNSAGFCKCSNNSGSSSNNIVFGFDVLPNFNRTFEPSSTNPCYDPDDPLGWIIDPDTNWVEVTLWYRDVYFPLFGGLPIRTMRCYRFAPSACTPAQTECGGFSWTFTQADQIEYPTNADCGVGVIDTSNVSITLTLGA